MSENPQLTKLHQDSFEQTIQKTLDLVENPDSQKSTGLQRLFLNGNNLKSLPKSLIQYGQLIELDLRDNPWNCDCNFRFIGERVSVTVSNNLYGKNEEYTDAFSRCCSSKFGSKNLCKQFKTETEMPITCKSSKPTSHRAKSIKAHW